MVRPDWVPLVVPCVGQLRGSVGRTLEVDDQIVPIDASVHASSKLIKNATLKVYPGAPHGLPWTHRDECNNNLLAFLKA
jgi:pimeloyl-ACP methyl ester carboxylesterase